jgi:hypothetical protein
VQGKKEGGAWQKEEEDGAKEVVAKKRVGEAMDDEEEEEVGRVAGNAVGGTRVAVVAMRCLVATRLVATYIAQG